MTTPAAAAHYMEQHLMDNYGRKIATFNPHGKPLDELPRIMVFNNSQGGGDWNSCVAIAESGHALGNHICSHENYAPHDLGVIEGTREDRHETYRKHYPDGYVMEFVPAVDIEGHERLQAAFKRNDEINKQS